MRRPLFESAAAMGPTMLCYCKLRTFSCQIIPQYFPACLYTVFTVSRGMKHLQSQGSLRLCAFFSRPPTPINLRRSFAVVSPLLSHSSVGLLVAVFREPGRSESKHSPSLRNNNIISCAKSRLTSQSADRSKRHSCCKSEQPAPEITRRVARCRRQAQAVPTILIGRHSSSADILRFE